MALFQDIEQENIQPQSTSEIGKYFENEFQQLQSERQKRYDEVKAEQDIWINNLISPDRIKEWKKQGAMTALEVWRRKKKNKLIPYMGTISHADDNFEIARISKRMAKGYVVTPEEKKKLEDFILDMAEMQTRGMTFGGGALNLGLETLPFVAEFGIGLLTTGGVASLGAVGSKIAQKGITETVKNIAKEGAEQLTKKVAQDGLGKTIAKGAGKVLYDATINPRTLAFSATRLPQQVYARMGDLELSDSVYLTNEGQAILNESEQKPATAFLKALGLTNIEVASEMAGMSLIDPAKKKLAGVIAPKILEAFPSKFTKTLVDGVEKFFNLPFAKAVDALGFNGIIEEMGEERVGDVLKFAFDLDNQEGYSFEQLLDVVFATPKELAQEALAFGAFGVGANIAHQGLKKVSEKYTKDQFLMDSGIFRTGGVLDKIDKKVARLLLDEGKTPEEIQQTLQFATRDDKVQYLKNKDIKTIEVDDENVLEKIQQQVADVYRASNKSIDEDTIEKISKVVGAMAKSIAEKENLTIDDIKDRLPSLEQVNQYMYADESGKGYTQDEINEVLELATNELYNLPEDFSDEAYVNNLSEDIRVLQDMANGKLEEADSARAWDILNRNVQRKDLGLLQQPDLQSKSTIELRTDKNKYLTDNEVEQVKIDSENFRNRINDFLNKKISPKSRITVLSALPSAYNQIPDLKGKKVIINQSIYSKIIDLPNKHKKNHNIDRKRALKLPELLADPLYILQSSSKGNEHRYVVVTSSKNNKPQERLSIILNPSNNVAIVSAYDEAININEEKKAKRVLYDKKKKLSKTFATSKDAMMDNSISSITKFQTDFKGDVKQHEGKNRLYQSAYFQENEPEQQNIFPGNRAAKKIHKVKGGYLPAEKFIELFRNADASTIVHECAHWYLDELTRIAQYNEEVAEDLEAVRRFLKNEGEDFTRAQHEKFARSFEAYILTGSSRNNKIKKVFEDFKNWLLQIYDEIKNLQIGIKEMPEITNLFDRLLTSEKQRSAAVFNKLSAIDEKIANIIEKQEQELDELDEIYSTNIQENNRKSDTKRQVEEYLELASKAAKREPKEVREFRERYKEATLQILEVATGYDRSFISQARNADKVEEAINNVEDKITISGGLRPEWQEFYADTGVNYDTDEVGGDYELASQAWQVFQDGTYKIDDSEYSDIEEFAGKFDYLYGKVLSLQGEERYIALEALYSLYNDIPAMPDEYLQDTLEKLQGIEETISEAEREAFNRKNFVNIPVVEHLQWFITDKIKNLKVYNPETKYRMRLDKSHRLYRFIKGATSINKAKVIVRKINEFMIEDLRNQQRAIIHKEIQKQVRINSKVLKTGNSAKGKFDWKTNTVFAELQELNKLSKDEALAKYEELAKLSELENSQMREGWDEKETKFDEFKNEFDLNLKRNFIEYKSQTGRLNENAKGQRVSSLNIQLGTKILEDIIKLKEIGREAKSEEEIKKKLNKRNYRNNFIELIREKGQKPWVRKFVTHLLHSGQPLANWETTLNAVFGSEVSQELSLLEDEAAIDSYKRRIANKLFNRIRKIYNMGKANAFEMALDYDNVQQIIDLFQSFEKEKYTILETSFDINTGEYFKTNVELTKNQIITLYGWYQNDNLRRRLETQYGAGELLTLFDIALGDKEKDLVWAVIDTLQEMYPDVNEVFINETGLSLPQEQNYIPSVAERIVSDLDMLHDCIMASKSPSATKRRKTSNRIKMNPSSLMEIVLPHIDKMSRYVILQEKLNFYRAIFNNANITAAFREVYGKKDGEALHREIKNQLEEFSFGSTNRRMGKLKEFADGVAKNFIVGSIGGSPKVALGQLSSMINYSEKMPIVEWSAGMTKSLANPVKTFKYMMKHSEYLQSRLAGNTQNEIIATLTNEADKFRKVTNFFTLNVKWGDIIAVTLGGKPYVDYLVSQGMSLEEAIKKFEAETMRAQQASTASSTSRWQKKQTETPYGRMFWAFRTVEFQFERKVYDAILMASRGEITPSQAIKTVLIYRVINPVIFSVLLQQFAIAPLLRMLFGDDDDPAETWKGLGISGALAVLTANLSHWGYFGIGASFVIQSALKYLSKDKKMKAFKTQVPFISDVEDVTTKLFKKDGPDMNDYIDAMAVGVKYGFGVPADKLVNFGEGVLNVSQGDIGIGALRMAGWGEYAATEAITGEVPKKKKRKYSKN